MGKHLSQAWLLVVLAAVFTVALTFASLELPYLTDGLLQRIVASPGFDSHVDDTSLLKAGLYIRHYHLRVIGYVCFGLTLVLIVAGFASRRSGLATIGAVAFLLPVFAQFAAVMFFLAGLGILNILWLPLLDVSFDLAKLGLIVRLPFDVVMWLFRQAGVNAYWPLVGFFIFAGLLIFFLGTAAWLLARSRGRNVADFGVYRISRHPQYLGWILWSYGVYLLLLRMHYPRRSWGIDASLPWLISTTIIIGVALMEELNMRRRSGEAYSEYHRKTPFLFPGPRRLAGLSGLPLRLLRRRREPQTGLDVLLLLAVYFLILTGLSALFYAGGAERIHRMVQSSESRQARIARTIRRMIDTPGRQRYFIARELAASGRESVPQLIDLLGHEDPEVREYAVDLLGEFRAAEASIYLLPLLEDTDEDVRRKAVESLAEIGAVEAKEPLIRRLADEVSSVRLAAIRSLASLGAVEAVDLMLPNLGDRHQWMRAAVADALGTLGSERAVPALIGCVSDEDPQVRRAAVVALMRIGSPAAIEAIRVATEDEDWEVRLYAAEALESVGDGLKTEDAPR